VAAQEVLRGDLADPAGLKVVVAQEAPGVLEVLGVSGGREVLVDREGQEAPEGEPSALPC